MKPVRNLRCPRCKNHWFMAYNGEADEIYCADCAQAKAMEFFGFNPAKNPASLPTYMFENVMDEMSRFMGREVKERLRDWQKPKLTPPPTVEWIRPSKAERKLLDMLCWLGLVALGFAMGFFVRGGS